MRFLRYILFVQVIVCLSACKTDFETNAPWKEIDVIYSLLGNYDSMRVSRDSVQYFRITKAYLNDDQNALKLAKEFDSLYHDTLDVTLQEMVGNFVVNSYKLERIFNTEKDSGLFANPGQYLYRTPSNFNLNVNAVYKLNVLNPITNVQASGATTIVNPPLPRFPSFTTTSINIRKGINGVVDWETGKNAKFYDLTLRINYSEFRNADSTKIGDFNISWPIFTFRTTNSTAGNERIQQLINGDDFYNFIMNHIQENPNVFRRMGLIDLIIRSGGDEIYTYIQVNRPSIGLVQKKPEYTNIDNGYGILSSRNTTIISVPLSEVSKNELVTTEPTRRLNFIMN